MALEAQAKAESDGEEQSEEGMSNVKRIVLIVKVLSALLVLALAVVLAYTIILQFFPAITTTDGDLEKLSSGRRSTSTDICNTIENADVKNTCVMNVAENRMDAKICSQIEDKNVYGICLYRVARKTKDKSLCEGIENANVKQECESL